MKRLSPYLFLSILAIGFFVFQTYWSNLSPVVFLLIFLLWIVPVADLFSPLVAVYGTLLNTSLLLVWSLYFNKGEHFYIVALLQIALTIYYLFIKKLTSDKYRKIRKSENYLRSIINTSLHPIIVKNRGGEVVLVSESINKFLGLKKKLPQGKDVVDLIHPDDIRPYLYFLKQVAGSPNQKKSMELRFKKGNDSWIWVKLEAINLEHRYWINSTLLVLQDVTLEKDTDFQKSELLKQEMDARSVAEKAVQDRDEFLSIASHELKTPLTSVILLLQSTLRKIMTQSLADFSGNDLLNSLKIVERQSQTLSRLIKDLLNVSLASTGRLSLNKETVNLSELVTVLVDKYSEEIKLSGCEVDLRVEDEVVGLWDAIRVEQAITNLLMNALKYAKGTRITMSVNTNGDQAIFTITDKGTGIDEEMQKEIFKPFQRGSNSQNTRGLGVGLFITKQIAEAHGGDISVHSRLEKGSTFTLSLPLSS